MGDFTKISGSEPKELEVMYSIYPNMVPEINYGRFNITNYPNIKAYEIIRSGGQYDDSVEMLERYKHKSTDLQMGSMFTGYLEVDSVHSIIEVAEVINLPGNIIEPPERSVITGKTIYRMKDGTLKASYFTGDLYYDIEDCKKIVIKGMNEVFKYADVKLKEIQEQIKNEKKLWEKPFLDYPHLLV